MNANRIKTDADYDAMPQVQFVAPRGQLFLTEANPLAVEGNILEAVALRTGYKAAALKTSALAGGRGAFWVTVRLPSGQLAYLAIVRPGKVAALKS